MWGASWLMFWLTEWTPAPIGAAVMRVTGDAIATPRITNEQLLDSN